MALTDKSVAGLANWFRITGGYPGSGINADMVDGMHWADIKYYIDSLAVNGLPRLPVTGSYPLTDHSVAAMETWLTAPGQNPGTLVNADKLDGMDWSNIKAYIDAVFNNGNPTLPVSGSTSLTGNSVAEVETWCLVAGQNPGTFTNADTVDGMHWWDIKAYADAAVPQGGTAEFTGPGTFVWTPPSGITKILLTLVGGGGGGGSGGDIHATAAGGGGGGGGGAVIYPKPATYVPVSAGTNYTVVVGAGGLGGRRVDGHPTPNTANGGASSFGSYVAGGGGKGGQGGDGGPGGVGGIASGLNSYVLASNGGAGGHNGANGLPCVGFSAGGIVGRGHPAATDGGGGGGGSNGVGGNGGHGDIPTSGSLGAAYGAGGGGGGYFGPPDSNCPVGDGGNGGVGYVKIEYSR
jgi:hypothetical protein